MVVRAISFSGSRLELEYDSRKVTEVIDSSSARQLGMLGKGLGSAIELGSFSASFFAAARLLAASRLFAIHGE